MSKIIVYILASDMNSPRLDNVKELWTNRVFTTKIVNLQDPTIQSNVIEAEYERYKWVLNDAKTNYTNNAIIIVKDTSISSASSDTIAKVVENTLERQEWSICYLCKWLDNCELYTNGQQIDGLSISIFKTLSPMGLQAIMLTPQGRDILLGTAKMSNDKTFTSLLQNNRVPLNQALTQAIRSGWIEASCTYPNIIDFDISTVSNETYNQNAFKTHQCRTTNNQYVTTNTKQWNIWGFLLAVLIIILIAWALLTLGKKD
jgi:hypothetical protein